MYCLGRQIIKFAFVCFSLHCDNLQRHRVHFMLCLVMTHRVDCNVTHSPLVLIAVVVLAISYQHWLCHKD
jgi:hypothetical protein